MGVGTVAQLVDRRAIWTDGAYEPYRGFFKVLARPVDGTLRQHELVHRFHDDWNRRIQAPYVIFDPALTRFDVTDPLEVATCSGYGGIEVWYDVPRVRPSPS